MRLAEFLLAASVTTAQPPVAGHWLTEDGGGVIAIHPCGTALCGRIVGMAESDPSGVQVDVHGRPLCGLEIIHGLVERDPGTWSGTITNPRDGRVYDARLRVDTQGRLHLRGFLGISLLGSTQIWTPYSGTVTAGCRMGA